MFNTRIEKALLKGTTSLVLINLWDNTVSLRRRNKVLHYNRNCRLRTFVFTLAVPFLLLMLIFGFMTESKYGAPAAHVFGFFGVLMLFATTIDLTSSKNCKGFLKSCQNLHSFIRIIDVRDIHRLSEEDLKRSADEVMMLLVSNVLDIQDEGLVEGNAERENRRLFAMTQVDGAFDAFKRFGLIPLQHQKGYGGYYDRARTERAKEEEPEPQLAEA